MTGEYAHVEASCDVVNENHRGAVRSKIVCVPDMQTPKTRRAPITMTDVTAKLELTLSMQATRVTLRLLQTKNMECKSC